MMYYLGLAALTAMLWSASGIIIKRISSRYGNLFSTLLISTGNMIILSIIVLLIGKLSISSYSLELSLLGGLLIAIGYLFFFKSLEKQQVSNTYSTFEIQVVILFFYSVFALGENITKVDIFGVIFIILGTLLISIEKSKFNKGLIPAIIANIFWGFGWIILIYPISHTSNVILPNLISFFTVLVLICIVILVSKKRVKSKKRPSINDTVIGISSGLFAGMGSSLYSILISFKEIAISTPIVNTAPVIISVIAHFVYKDRLSHIQALGIIIVVAGGIILSLS